MRGWSFLRAGRSGSILSRWEGDRWKKIPYLTDEEKDAGLTRGNSLCSAVEWNGRS